MFEVEIGGKFMKYTGSTAFKPTQNGTHKMYDTMMHHSYHFSDGTALLCDFQGSRQILTDPLWYLRAKATNTTYKQLKNSGNNHHCIRHQK